MMHKKQFQTWKVIFVPCNICPNFLLISMGFLAYNAVSGSQPIYIPCNIKYALIRFLSTVPVNSGIHVYQEEGD